MQITEEKSFTTPLFVFVPIVLIIVILCAAICFSEFLATTHQRLKSRISASFSRRGAPAPCGNSPDSASCEVREHRGRDSVEASFEGVRVVDQDAALRV